MHTGVLGIPSVRDYTYENTVGSNSQTEIPESFILPEELIPIVRHQKEESCVAQATAGIIDIFYYKEYGIYVEHSTGYIYARHRNMNHTGMYPDTVANSMRVRGSVPVSVFNINCEMPDIKRIVDERRDDLDKLAEKTRIEGFVGFNNYNRYADMKRALYEHRCPILAISNSYFGSPHAILIIGYKKDGFLILNSWGKGWGDNGRKWLKTADINYGYLFLDEVIKLKFLDVKETDWFYKAIKEAVCSGIMKGRSEIDFSPLDNMNRAEAAQFGVNILKKIDESNEIMLKTVEQMIDAKLGKYTG